MPENFESATGLKLYHYQHRKLYLLRLQLTSQRSRFP